MLTGAVLLTAAMTTGLVAGVFLLYAHTIMPGLGRTDDRTFVGAFQSIDRAIINPWFMSCFFGALILTSLSVLLLWPSGGRALPWVAVALVLYLLVVGITLVVNVPLNDAIKAAGDLDRITDLARVRLDLNEAKWRVWNLVRVVMNTAAFGCLLVALMMYGRRR